jgi:ornithine cyclodeaminase/alanine dehydrogenase-like protein (mu-crystallin family)
MPPPYLGPQELRNALSMKDAIDALDDAFSGELPTAPPRSHLDVGRGDLLLMPAWSDDLGTGVKLVTVAPDNPAAGLPLIHGVYVLFDSESLHPAALLDGAALTGTRTAAVSAVATRHLARPGSRTLLVFGGGTQGIAHIEAIAEVLPKLERVLCVSRSAPSAKRLVDRAAQLGYRAEAASPDAVELADVVCTCTTSSSPLFNGAHLRAGAHVNAVGSYEPNARELDDAVIARSKVFVEVKEPALHEAGDLRLPVEAGVLDPGDVTELGDVAGGRAGGRTSVDDITVFKSVGVAFEDLVVAAAAVRGST